jgi:hypothetical protein
MNRPDQPRTYEEWLSFDDQQREAVLTTWNAYEREGIGFAYTAAGRLAIASEIPVVDLRVGTYHGGEYILHAYVDDAAVSNLPKMLAQKFEGFRVAWYPVSRITTANQ